MKESLLQITLKDIIALGGLIIACITLGWNILNEIRKIPKAKVTVMLAKHLPTVVNRNDQTYFHITISNVGTRPIMIKGIAGVAYQWWWPPFKKQWYIILPQKLPIYLKDGEDHYESFPYTAIQFKELLNNHIQRIAIWDSIGRYHYISGGQMRKLRRDIRNFLNKKETISDKETG
ncbi:MAG: hypothetical protein PHG68_06335 [Candidatus Omnitrophica bacterium]|nr:hypothetical protein [Candidatus Omnitrophota bacterium]